METITDILSQWISDPDTLRMIVISITTGTFIALGIGVFFLLQGLSDPVRRRIDTLTEETDELAGQRHLVKIESSTGPISHYVLPKQEIERTRVSALLTHAGFRGPNALQTFFALRAVSLILLPAATLFAFRFFPGLSVQKMMIYLIAATGFGYLLPSYILDKLVAKQLNILRKGFPDALDLLVVCVEAGLGLTQALQRVSQELVVSHPQLAAEFALVNAEMRAGVERVTSLKNLADRTGLDDIRGLVSLLVQTLKFGTSVAESLRVYSEEFRDKRMQKAEEEAAKMGTKMIFPLVLFMFPAFFVVAIGPAIIGILDSFGRL